MQLNQRKNRMKKREKRTPEQIIESIINAIKENGPLTREEIDFHCDYPRTSENHLPKLRKDGLVHISEWKIKNVPGRYEAMFDIGNKPDALRPKKKNTELLKPSEPDRRAIFFDESEAMADLKYRKQYRPAPRRINVSWLGAI